MTSFATLLLFQLAGELLHTALGIPLPGSVLGMGLLTAWLISRSRMRKDFEISPALARTADGLLAVLGLLFIPAGVGIISNLALLRASWLAISVSLLLSTLLSLVVTAGVMHVFVHRGEQGSR